MGYYLAFVGVGKYTEEVKHHVDLPMFYEEGDKIVVEITSTSGDYNVEEALQYLEITDWPVKNEQIEFNKEITEIMDEILSEDYRLCDMSQLEFYRQMGFQIYYVLL